MDQKILATAERAPPERLTSPTTQKSMKPHKALLNSREDRKRGRGLPGEALANTMERLFPLGQIPAQKERLEKAFVARATSMRPGTAKPSRG